MFGKGDCSELEYCSKRGTCVDGQCVCPPGYLDAMCKINMECKYWDEEQQVWSTDGVNTTLSADGTSVECLTSHLTTFGGILDIPTSTEELLAELANAFKFQTFTMDEMFSLLSNFNLGDNPTIIIVVTILILSDIISLLILGFYRGRRARIRRERTGVPFEDEKLVRELADLKSRLTQVRAGRLVVEKIKTNLMDESKAEDRRKSAIDRQRQAKASLLVGSALKANAAKGKRPKKPSLLAHKLTVFPGRKSAKVTPNEGNTGGASSSPPPSPPEQGNGAHEESTRSSASRSPPEQGNGAHEESTRSIASRRLETQKALRELKAIQARAAARAAEEAAVAKERKEEEEREEQEGEEEEEEEEKPKRLLLCRAINGFTWWIKDGCGRVIETARNEHTVVNLLWTPDDEDALTPPQSESQRMARAIKKAPRTLQLNLSPSLASLAPLPSLSTLSLTSLCPSRMPSVLHLFWTALAVELFVICFQYNGPVGEEPAAGGGRRGGAGAATAMQDPNALGASTFAISPITALTQGVIASGICIGMLNMLSYVFRWGNNRHRRVGDRTGWLARSRQAIKGTKRKMRKLRRQLKRWRNKRSRRVLADWEEEQMQKEEEAEAWAEALDAERKAREDLPPTGMEYQEKRQMTFVGKLCCLFFPVIGLLAFCLCMEKRRVLVPKDGELVGLGDDDDNDNDDGDGGGDGGGGEGGKATPTHRQKLAEKGAEFVAHLRLDESVPKGAEAQRAAERLQLAFKRRQGRFEIVRRAAERAEALKYEQAVQRLQASYRGSKSRQTLKTLQAVTRLQRSMRRHLEAPSTDPSGSSSAGFILSRATGALWHTHRGHSR